MSDLRFDNLDELYDYYDENNLKLLNEKIDFLWELMGIRAMGHPEKKYTTNTLIALEETCIMNCWQALKGK